MAADEVTHLKGRGNEAFSSGRFEEAVELFGKAIDVAKTGAGAEEETVMRVLYSNRSAAYAGKRSYKEALGDADLAITASPAWVKGYARKGAALLGLGQLDEAKAAYEEGLAKDAQNAMLQRGLQEVIKAQEAKSAPPQPNFQNPFGSPQAIATLMKKNPKFLQYMQDPAFMAKLSDLQKDPNNLTKYISDPRIMECLGALMGVDVMGATPPGAAPAADEPFAPSASTSAKAKESEPPVAPAPEPELSEDEKRVKEILAEAEVEKTKGNTSYKAKEFPTALQHYAAALAIVTQVGAPTDAALTGMAARLYLNTSAVHLEAGQAEEALASCNTILDEGLAARDGKLLAKTYGRMGTIEQRLNKDLEKAIKWYGKSLTESRTADVLTKMKEAEKNLSKQKAEAYRDPALADAARSAGNEAFKAADYAAAVKHYTEAAARSDPTDPRPLGNRAAAYMKLTAMPEALRDCDTCIKMDPSFVKAYIRKATIQHLKREYEASLKTLTEARTADASGKHAAEIAGIERRCHESLSAQMTGQSGESQEEVLARAMADPEVAGIMTDPIMQQILQQAQTDPKALRDHMKNPMIAAKIRKLAAAGVIRVA